MILRWVLLALSVGGLACLPLFGDEVMIQYGIDALLFATVATLFFVPCVFSIIHGWLERRRHRTMGTEAAVS